MTSAEPRTSPYVWVTWLAPLLTCEAHCQWQTWFQAHNKLARPEFDTTLAAANLIHAEMVRLRAAQLRDEGYAVRVEDENWFSVQVSGGNPRRQAGYPRHEGRQSPRRGLQEWSGTPSTSRAGHDLQLVNYAHRTSRAKRPRGRRAAVSARSLGTRPGEPHRRGVPGDVSAPDGQRHGVAASTEESVLCSVPTLQDSSRDLFRSRGRTSNHRRDRSILGRSNWRLQRTTLGTEERSGLNHQAAGQMAHPLPRLRRAVGGSRRDS